MNILLQKQTDVEAFFNKKATMAPNLLDMVGQGEEASGWLLGSMDNGFDLTVGFFSDNARYIAFKKRSGTLWTEADTRACLLLIGDIHNWSTITGAQFFDYVEREDGKPNGKVLASATGWNSPERKYVFVYVPTVPGEIALLPAKDSIDKNFPT
jgi:hypothetical protein